MEVSSTSATSALPSPSGALTRGQRFDRGGKAPVALARFQLRIGRRYRIGHMLGGSERQIRRAPFGIEAEIDHDAIEPGAELRLRPPARRIDPDPQESVLHDVFGHRLVAEDAPCQSKRPSRMPLRQYPKCPLVTLRGARHEVMIGWPIHAGAQSAVVARKTHAAIVRAGGRLVAPQPAERRCELWETSQSVPAIPI
jgi:hypothetical protein